MRCNHERLTRVFSARLTETDWQTIKDYMLTQDIKACDILARLAAKIRGAGSENKANSPTKNNLRSIDPDSFWGA